MGTQAQWIATIVRPPATEVQVANPSRIPWLFRAGRNNDSTDARKLATLLYLNQLPTVHLPAADISAWRAFGYACPHGSRGIDTRKRSSRRDEKC